MAGVESQDSAVAARSVAAARWWHGATFAVATFGVIVQLVVVATQALTADMVQLSRPVRLWNVLSYFTVWSNILVAVVAYLLVRNPRRDGSVFNVVRLASVVMITVTGLIYAAVLAQLWDPVGWQKVADQTMHYAVPALAVIGCLLFGPGPRFRLQTLWRSLGIPLVWLGYTLVRSPFITYDEAGETRHWYPYDFIDVDDLGYGGALLNVLGVLLLFLALGGAFVLIDRLLPPRPVA
ncbi:Pr6Pr family membrane protein [Nocardioides alcanivorans]|uniref:Pr6Pr family membrane protein n=1 Tax=Nocardioides alcanivorans TaxID=2897352 RepID=UPI001F326E27|nr:Pr6Pr family membrane protein [Nocardioides alcanivorans]